MLSNAMQVLLRTEMLKMGSWLSACPKTPNSLFAGYMKNASHAIQVKSKVRQSQCHVTWIIVV